MLPVDVNQQRARLVRVAYRITGRVSVAEELAQDALLKLACADGVRRPEAWLTTVLTRLCLNYLKAAATVREQYVGGWIPDPWVVELGCDETEREDVSMAMLILLQQLPATHRAAFILRELFDCDYADIAISLDCTQATARQWTRRARTKLKTAQRPPAGSLAPDDQMQLLMAFGQACQTGDLQQLKSILSTDVTAFADSDGKVPGAGLRPVDGPDRVARLYMGLHNKLDPDVVVQPCWVNDQLGLSMHNDGRLTGIVVFLMAKGQIWGIRSLVNPDRLVTLPLG